MAVREDLVQSAVQFLKNPQVQSSPMTRKIAFLEQKGMTQEEIEEAMRRTSGTTSSASTPAAAPVAQQPAYSPAPQQPYYGAPAPPLPPYPQPAQSQWGWKDVFIGAVVAVGGGYMALNLLKQYVGPMLKWPSQADLEVDRKDLDEKFKATSTSLTSVQGQTAGVLAALESQNAQVKEALEAMEKALKDLSKTDKDREDDVKALKQDIDSVKELIPKMMEKTKEDQKYAISELQGELKSLKSLLLNRTASSPAVVGTGTGTGTTVASPSLPITSRIATPPWQSTNVRPSIPAWQLAQTQKAEEAPAQDEKGKAKEQDQAGTSVEKKAQEGAVGLEEKQNGAGSEAGADEEGNTS